MSAILKGVFEKITRTDGRCVCGKPMSSGLDFSYFVKLSNYQTKQVPLIGRVSREEWRGRQKMGYYQKYKKCGKFGSFLISVIQLLKVMLHLRSCALLIQVSSHQECSSGAVRYLSASPQFLTPILPRPGQAPQDTTNLESNMEPPHTPAHPVSRARGGERKMLIITLSPSPFQVARERKADGENSPIS